MRVRTMRFDKLAIRLMLAAAFGLFSFGIVSADVAVPGCSGGIGNTAQLQADVAAINANNEDDVIQLGAGCIYDLTEALSFSSDGGHAVTIEGNGATISGVHNVRGLIVNAGANLTVNNVTIRDGLGLPTGSGAFGGAIWNDGKLTLNNSTVTGSTAQQNGGGIVNFAELTLNNSAVSGNHADAKGGGIANSGLLTLNGSIVLGNTSANTGGGIHNAGVVELINSAVTGNEAGTDGGGYFGNGIGAWLSLEKSAVVNNSGSTGGGIAITDGANASLENSTIYGNIARDGDGGGLYSGVNTSLLLEFVTIAGNGATSLGGGLFVLQSGTVELAGGTIIADSLSGGDCVNNGTLEVVRANLIEDGTCANDVFKQDPGLGPIEGFPGHLPLVADSFAIDQFHHSDCPDHDQRGVSRPLDGDGDGQIECDLGAYEAPAVPVVVTNIELLRNRFFNEVAVRGNPLGWDVKNKTGDKYACTSAITAEGPRGGICGFMFKGSTGENAKLIQTIDLTGIQFTQGDTLTLSGYFHGPNAKTKAKLKLSVTYEEGPTPIVSSQTIRTMVFEFATLPEMPIDAGTIQKITVMVNNKSTAGKLYIDYLSLNLHLSSAVRTTPLPLPAAPANFRSNN